MSRDSHFFGAITEAKNCSSTNKMDSADCAKADVNDVEIRSRWSAIDTMRANSRSSGIVSERSESAASGDDTSALRDAETADPPPLAGELYPFYKEPDWTVVTHK